MLQENQIPFRSRSLLMVRPVLPRIHCTELCPVCHCYFDHIKWSTQTTGCEVKITVFILCFPEIIHVKNYLTTSLTYFMLFLTGLCSDNLHRTFRGPPQSLLQLSVKQFHRFLVKLLEWWIEDPLMWGRKPVRGERILFFGPNTNTNNIRNQNFDRIWIRIIFVFSEWANTNTNNIRAQIFGRIRIRIIFGFRIVPEYEYE